MPKKANKLVPVVSADDLPSTSERKETSTVLYIGHLPHGFYEKELQGFFSQFGDVKHVKVSRSKKTGNAKHFAFLEFKSPEVAAIAAEAMDGYMLFTQKLVCSVLEQSAVHPDLFKGTHRRFKKVPWAKVEAQRHNQPRTTAQHAQRVARALSRDRKRSQLLKAAGIMYDYEILSAEPPAKEASPAPTEAPAKKNKKKKKKASAV